MRRPVGVVIAGVLLLLLGLFGLLMLGLQVLGLTAGLQASPSIAPHAGLLLLMVDAIFGAFCLGCGWTAVGLFQMRRWARIVTIVLSVLIACCSGMAAVMMLLVRNLLPPTPRVSPEALAAFFLVLGLIYFAVGLLALWWAIYFNFRSVRIAFAQAELARQQRTDLSEIGAGGHLDSGAPEANPAALPVVGLAKIVVLISAVFSIAGSLTMVVMAWLEIPMFCLGLILDGRAAILFELLWASLLLYTGIGLFRRWRTGWVLAVALQLYAVLSAILLLIPGYATRALRVGTEFHRRFSQPGGDYHPQTASQFLMAISAISGAIALAILVALVSCRGEYVE